MCILFPFAWRILIWGKAFVSTTFICCILTKIFLASDYLSREPGDALWLPSALLLDWLYLQALVFLMHLTSGIRKMVWLRGIVLCFLYLLVIWCNFANAMTVTFYAESETVINWYTMRDQLINVTGAQARMTMSVLPLLIRLHSGFLIVWLLLYLFFRYQAYKTSLSQFYMPVHRPEEASLMEEAILDVDGVAYPHSKCFPILYKFTWSRESLLDLMTKRNMAYVLFTVFLTTYIILCLTIKPLAPWSELNSNFGAKSLYAMLIYPYISHSNLPVSIADFKYSATHEFLAKFSNMTFGRNSTMEDQDFDFLQRNKSSIIKNVVFMILETTRNDIVPFDYFSEFSERLESKFREEQRDRTLNPNSTLDYSKGISPFFEDLMRRGGFYLPYAKSLSGYTLKSLITTHCGMMPLRTPGASERTHLFYQACLPELLQKYSNYSTEYFQTSDGGFDNQRSLIKKLGFDFVFDKQAINGGALDQYNDIPRLDNGKFEEINYFGYEDKIIIPKMVDWIGEQKDAGKPFFLTHLNNAAHHPYGQPKRWDQVGYLENPDSVVNNYLNSIRYVDDFMRDFLAAFEKTHPETYEKTLFMFVGDHGVSLREHHIMHAYQNPYEYAFNVPLLFYSPNNGVQKYLTKQFSRNIMKKDAPEVQQDGRLHRLYQRGATNLVLGNWTNLDILPTILNLFKENQEAERGNFGYEGSSITGPNDPKRITMSLATPGGFSTTLRYGNHKLLKSSDGSLTYYDLFSDPTELRPKQIYELSNEMHEWVLAADGVIEQWSANINKAYHFLHSS